jgi:hypothetical protein
MFINQYRMEQAAESPFRCLDPCKSQRVANQPQLTSWLSNIIVFLLFINALKRRVASNGAPFNRQWRPDLAPISGNNSYFRR